jgi:hypothetical protein
LLCAASTSFAACPPAGIDRDELVALKRSEWKVADDSRRQVLAIGLLDCLASPDPVLRDELAFEALARWARSQQLTVATLQAMRSTLVAGLQPDGADAEGFAQPFAALALAEVARADRMAPYLGADERAGLVTTATRYVASVRDYRASMPGRAGATASLTAPTCCCSSP